MDSVRIRNQATWGDALARLRGSNVQLELDEFDDELDAVEHHERNVRGLPDAALGARMTALRSVWQPGSRPVRDSVATRPRAALRAEVYALVRDAARRALGQRPYDVQVVAALALDRGAVVEMQTGEGKTLTATMPVALQAMEGRAAPGSR
jgi:preprotein translocase subunit SecA